MREKEAITLEEGVRKLTVRHHLAGLKADQCFPYLDLEVRAAQYDMHAIARGHA